MISIDADKALDKIQHPLIIKTLSKLGTERICLNIRATYDKATPNVILNKNTKSASLKNRNKTGMSAFISLIKHSS